MLQRLVGKVDAELLEAVVLVVLKAKDVQHPDGQDLKHGHISHQHQWLGLEISQHENGEHKTSVSTRVHHIVTFRRLMKVWLETAAKNGRKYVSEDYCVLVWTNKHTQGQETLSEQLMCVFVPWPNPPGLCCRAARDWCGRRSSRTELRTETSPSSPSPSPPAQRHECHVWVHVKNMWVMFLHVKPTKPSTESSVNNSSVYFQSWPKV